jgi:hypothetical protein
MMILSQPTKNPVPQLPCALTEFVSTLLSNSVWLNLKIDPPAETPDP